MACIEQDAEERDHTDMKMTERSGRRIEKRRREVEEEAEVVGQRIRRRRLNGNTEDENEFIELETDEDLKYLKNVQTNKVILNVGGARFETSRDYLDSRKDNASSVSSGVMSIDLLQRMNFNVDHEQTYQREKMLTEMPGISSEVRSPVQYGQIHESMPAPFKNFHSQCRPKT